jgi:hypothetical protein
MGPTPDPFNASQRRAKEMAEDAVPPAAPTTLELEARIRALESQLAAAHQEIERQDNPEPARTGRRTRRTPERDLSEETRDTAERTIDEASRLFRGMTMAYAEGLRSAADAVGAFSDELSRRRDSDRDKKDRERIGKLPEDFYAGYLKAVNRALTIPERTVERFQEAYKDERDKEKDKPPVRDDSDQDRDAQR